MYKILVVDDEIKIVKVLKDFLAKMEFEVIEAYGGKEAIEVFNSQTKIDLLILDMKMPKVNGIDVLREVKRINKEIPVIILTGSIYLDNFIDDLSKLGYVQEDILYKPIDLFTLLDMVKKKLKIA